MPTPLSKAFLDLTEAQTFSALRAFLLAVLPDGVEVMRAQDNRVPEPTVPDFVIMSPLRRPRLATNIDTYNDVVMTAAIADDVLTVSAIGMGAIQLGAPIVGANVAPNTIVKAFGSGSGGVGTYTVTPGAQAVSSEAMLAGCENLLQKTDVVIQLDVHGPSSADNSQIIATLMRDDIACEAMAATDGRIQPLYADDPKQSPFFNGENQVEYRWVVEAHLEANPTVTMLQQFAATLSVEGLIPVDVVYPP